jgi:hypothetical protein
MTHYLICRMGRSCLIYAFAASVGHLRPASVAGLTRGLTGYFGFMRQLLASDPAESGPLNRHLNCGQLPELEHRVNWMSVEDRL